MPACRRAHSDHDSSKHQVTHSLKSVWAASCKGSQELHCVVANIEVCDCLRPILQEGQEQQHKFIILSQQLCIDRCCITSLQSSMTRTCCMVRLASRQEIKLPRTEL